MRRGKSLAVILSPLLLAACLLAGDGNILVVKPYRAGLQMMPREMTSVLLDQDYERVRVKETGIDWGSGGFTDETSYMMQHQGSMIVTTNEYRMLFRSLSTPDLFVQVRIKRASGVTKLTFYEEGRKGLSESSRGRLRAVREKLILRYGADRVQVK